MESIEYSADRVRMRTLAVLGLVPLLTACQVLFPHRNTAPPAADTQPIIQTLPYERTNPPAPRGYASRTLPARKSLDVATASPRKPAVYPPGTEPPKLKPIGGGAPPVPAWVRGAETTTTPSSLPSTPSAYVHPEYALRLPAPPAELEQPYSPPPRYSEPPPAPRRDPRPPPSPPPEMTARAPEPAPARDWFDTRVTEKRPAYELREPARADAGAQWRPEPSVERAPEPAAPVYRRPEPLPAAEPRYAPTYTPPPAPAAAPSRPVAAAAPAYPAPGRDLRMDARPSLPAPVARADLSTAPQGVILGPGDVVTINVLGRPELEATVDVNGDGEIVVPLAGAVPVSGLSTADAGERVARALREGEFVVNPQVTLFTTESRSQQISVLGEVKSPARFKIETRTTVLDGIAQAGGIADTGANFAYILRREGSVIVRYELDLDALLEAGAGQEYFELQAGDTVVVPKAELFYIYGEVRAPNVYRIKPGMLLIQALSLAGGLTDKGSERRIIVRRRDERGELREFSASLNDPVLSDDVIYVKERFF